FVEKAHTQLGQRFIVPVAVAGNEREGARKLRSVTSSVIPNNAPQGNSAEDHTIASGNSTSNNQALRVTANGGHQVIHGLVAVNALLPLIRRGPLDELKWMPALVGDPGQQADWGAVRRKDISPEAICHLRSDLDGFPGPQIEEIHAGSRSG